MSTQAEDVVSAELPDCEKSLAYWLSISADTNGMLGGYPQISRIDLHSSTSFLTKLKSRMPKERPWKAADCGAGIGRVTKGFLIKHFETVDIVEPVKKFTDAIEVESDSYGVIGDVFNVGLQDWHPAPDTYTMIWNQWCVGHLTDVDFVAYLKRCIPALQPHGIIGVKENIATTLDDVYDAEDSSVTRTDKKFCALFEQAGLKIIKTELQKGFPANLGLFPVRIYALQPV